MNVTQIRKQVRRIKECGNDCERAHGLEDELRAKFIEYVAVNAPLWLAEKATEVLKTDKLDFPRYCG